LVFGVWENVYGVRFKDYFWIWDLVFGVWENVYGVRFKDYFEIWDLVFGVWDFGFYTVVIYVCC